MMLTVGLLRLRPQPNDHSIALHEEMMAQEAII
jgi:hypothetical protein